MLISASSRPSAILAGLCLALAAMVAACATPAKGPAGEAPVAAAALTPAQRELNVRSLEVVWETVRDKHFDPTLGGLDWPACRAEFLPRVAAATTAEEARGAMTAMLARLGQSHFGIIPAEAYEGVSGEREHPSGGASKSAAEPTDFDGTSEPTGPGEAGLTIRVIDSAAVVASVRAGGAAERAGVRPGWIVEEVAGKRIGPVIERVRRNTAGEGFLEARLALALEGRFGGDAGDELKIVFLDAADVRTERTLTLMPETGLRAKLGNLPEMLVRFESARVAAGTVGYIHLSTFLEPGTIMPKFAEAVGSMRDCRGMVLDLRGNVGGIAAMGMGIGGLFVDKPNQKLGTMAMRTLSLNFVLNPRLEPFTGPLAILVDEMSLSTSEILAGGLQDLGRARVFGTRTGGAALPSVIERLPNGDGFQYAFANYTSVGGAVLEGRGVMPDEVLPLTRAALLAGQDPALDAAVRWIQKQAASESGGSRN
ncbi:MAG: S41 family peptidase [Phycisphaerales bacterium]